MGATIDWEDVREFFAWDGSWRTLYVFGTTELDWDRVWAALLASRFDTKVVRGDEVLVAPKSVAWLFPVDETTPTALLSAIAGGVVINAHFFQPDEIEFDIDPSEVTGPDQFAVVAQFMRLVVDAVSKPMVLTYEACREHAELVAEPGGTGLIRPPRNR